MTPTMPTIVNLLKVSNNKNNTSQWSSRAKNTGAFFVFYQTRTHSHDSHHFQTDYHRKSIPEEFLHCPKKMLNFPLKSKGYPTCLSTHYQAVIGFTVHDMA